MVEWLSSRAPMQAAQCFVGSNPGRGHGTAHQTTLRQRPTCHNQKDPQRNIQLCTGGLWGEKGEKFKKSLKKKKLTNISRLALKTIPHYVGTVLIKDLRHIHQI